MSEQSREAAIRLVVAVQWGEAIAVLTTENVLAWGDGGSSLDARYATRLARLIASVPCAVDVVDAFWPRGEV